MQNLHSGKTEVLIIYYTKKGQAVNAYRILLEIMGVFQSRDSAARNDPSTKLL